MAKRGNMLTGLKPNGEGAEDKVAIDAIAESMLARGFVSLWSRPSNPSIVQFGDREKRIYLLKLATSGRRALSAAHAGTTRHTVNAHKKKDPVFAASCEEATAYFRDLLVGEMYRRGVEGFEQEVLGGRNKDQIIKVKMYSDKMLDTLGRIHIKEMQKPGDSAVTVHETKIINNQFDLASMPAEDLAMVKQLLLNQQKRVEDAEATAGAIEGEVLPDGQ